MFGMGMTELLVIFGVALLVLGPKRLPELASGLGKAIREFRKATRDLTDQIEVDDSVRKPIMELKAALRDEPAPFEPKGAAQAPVAAAPAAPLPEAKEAAKEAAKAEAAPSGGELQPAVPAPPKA